MCSKNVYGLKITEILCNSSDGDIICVAYSTLVYILFLSVIVIVTVPTQPIFKIYRNLRNSKKEILQWNSRLFINTVV